MVVNKNTSASPYTYRLIWIKVSIPPSFSKISKCSLAIKRHSEQYGIIIIIIIIIDTKASTALVGISTSRKNQVDYKMKLSRQRDSTRNLSKCIYSPFSSIIKTTNQHHVIAYQAHSQSQD